MGYLSSFKQACSLLTHLARAGAAHGKGTLLAATLSQKVKTLLGVESEMVYTNVVQSYAQPSSPLIHITSKPFGGQTSHVTFHV